MARIFLGDVGSLPIGLLFGWLLVLLAGNGHLAAALLLPLYYLADATITLLRRLTNREPFWQAHRTHFYQRATDRGFSVSGEIVAQRFAVNVALVALAIGARCGPGPPVAHRAWLGGIRWSAAAALVFRARQAVTRILVTGASGFIGRALVAELAGLGHSVRAAMRQPADVFPRSVEVVAVSDLTRPVEWRAAARHEHGYPPSPASPTPARRSPRTPTTGSIGWRPPSLPARPRPSAFTISCSSPRSAPERAVIRRECSRNRSTAADRRLWPLQARRRRGGAGLAGAVHHPAAGPDLRPRRQRQPGAADGAGADALAAAVRALPQPPLAAGAAEPDRRHSPCIGVARRQGRDIRRGGCYAADAGRDHRGVARRRGRPPGLLPVPPRSSPWQRPEHRPRRKVAAPQPTTKVGNSPQSFCMPDGTPKIDTAASLAQLKRGLAREPALTRLQPHPVQAIPCSARTRRLSITRASRCSFSASRERSASGCHRCSTPVA